MLALIDRMVELGWLLHVLPDPAGFAVLFQKPLTLVVETALGRGKAPKLPEAVLEAAYRALVGRAG